MAIQASEIKELRERTGAGVSDVKQALEESGGDMEKAEKLLERKLGAAAERKANRATRAGLVESYIHSNGRVGSLVEIFCETDFVARTPEFKKFAHEIAMHIAAMQPRYQSLDTIPREVREAERAHVRDSVLMEQPFIRNPDKKISDVVAEAVGRFGENIHIGRFSWFSI